MAESGDTISDATTNYSQEDPDAAPEWMKRDKDVGDSALSQQISKGKEKANEKSCAAQFDGGQMAIPTALPAALPAAPGGFQMCYRDPATGQIFNVGKNQRALLYRLLDWTVPSSVASFPFTLSFWERFLSPVYVTVLCLPPAI